MLRRVYPYDYQCSLMSYDTDGISQKSMDEFEKAVDTAISDKSLDFRFINMTYLIKTTAICFAVFAVIYALVYKLTSNAYYRILTVKTE